MGLGLALLLAGCASAPRERVATALFMDAAFHPPVERTDARAVFALSPEMRQYLDAKITEPARKKGRQVALVDALYSQGELKLDYDTGTTRTAAQAFAARSGNCLSLVIMTAAFAKALDLPVTYQKVSVDDEWARSGDLYLAIGHVNLTLGKRRTDEGGFGYRVGARPPESDGMTIDFLPPEDLRRMRARAIDEEVIVGMFMNNRAVEALADGRVDDAYWSAREGIVQAPGFYATYNTLGAVYRRHGDLAEAERVFAYVVAREPENIQALSNLVAVLGDLGRTAEAQRFAARLKEIDPEPAFSHFKRGLAAFQAGDMRTARDAFAREVARAPDYHEFHFWLAIAYWNLGETGVARDHLAIALKTSPTRRDHAIYAAKLERLNQQH